MMMFSKMIMPILLFCFIGGMIGCTCSMTNCKDKVSIERTPNQVVAIAPVDRETGKSVDEDFDFNKFLSEEIPLLARFLSIPVNADWQETRSASTQYIINNGQPQQLVTPPETEVYGMMIRSGSIKKSHGRMYPR